MGAVEFVADRATKTARNLAGPILRKACKQRGDINRVKGESLLLAPPLIITAEEVEQNSDYPGRCDSSSYLNG